MVEKGGKGMAFDQGSRRDRDDAGTRVDVHTPIDVEERRDGLLGEIRANCRRCKDGTKVDLERPWDNEGGEQSGTCDHCDHASPNRSLAHPSPFIGVY